LVPLLFTVSGNLLPVTAAAQAAEEIILSAPDISQFPLVSFSMEMFDDSGNFIADLTADQVKVVEDGIALPLATLDRSEPGIQIILAYNPSTAFAVSAPGGNYFSYIQKTIEVWTQNQPAGTPNTLSITSNTGIHADSLTEPAVWQQAVSTFQPQINNVEANLVSLTLALDLATEPVIRPGMKTVIFYITSLLPAGMETSMQNQVGRAAQIGVPVYVWLVAPGGTADTPAAEPLIQLAGGTGGEFYVVSTSEELPGFDSYLQPMRFNYEAAYQSQAAQSGTHSFFVEVDRQGTITGSAPQSFTVDLRSPAPIFLSPPPSLQRVWLEGEDGKKALLPSELTLKYLVEYPDGYLRELREAILYVDGEAVVRDTEAPFESLVLPLDGYQDTQVIEVQVEVVDILGMRQRSLATSIIIESEPSIRDLWKEPKSFIYLGLAIAGLLALAGGIYFIIRQYRSGKLQLPQRKQKLAPRKGRKPALNRSPALKHGSKSSLGRQPVPPSQLTYRTPPRVTLPLTPAGMQPQAKTGREGALPGKTEPPAVQEKTVACAPARLVWLGEEGPAERTPLILVEAEVTIGNDARHVSHFIDSPALNPRHAMLQCDQEGTWRLADCKSIAGTYLNYDPVGTQPVPLRHGDIIQLGGLAFRFEEREPKEIPHPVVESG
jgi:hypothetical protein